MTLQIVQWAGFIIIILALLALDLGVLRKKSKTVSPKEALQWTCVCVALALLFNVYIYFAYNNNWLGYDSPLDGAEAAQQYFTAWLIEQSLSLDNVFVFALVFSYFKVPSQFQHRVLFWGVVGALVMRGIMIALGATLLKTFVWTEYVFGALLLYAAIKMMKASAESFDPTKNILFRVAKAIFPVSSEYDGEKFFTVENGRKAITPLFLVLIVIESTDVLFAVDSIPAVFAVTSDPFIVFTSNIFAILNLRSLYFGLSALIAKFEKLKLALVLVLIFVALKMMFGEFLHISTTLSLGIISTILFLGIVGSLLRYEDRSPK